jgi:hypothetical protein
MTSSSIEQASPRESGKSKQSTSEAINGPTVDGLLTKYVHVWLGTMVLGTTTGVGFNILTYGGSTRWGALGPFFGFVFLASLAAAAVSWYAILRYWSDYLIPLFFRSTPYPGMLDDGDRKRAASNLRLSIMAILLAGTLRALITLLQFVLSNLAG